MTQDDLKVLLKYMSRDIGEIAYDGTVSPRHSSNRKRSEILILSVATDY